MKNLNLRKARGKISVAKICEDLGISESSYRKYELGIRTPRDEQKKKIAEYLNADIVELFFCN